MTFAYPMLLGGLVLAALPVVLHFLIRQKPRTLAFPAFRFLMQQRRTNTRKLRLKHLLLMLLRVALLVLLCLALARPRMLHEQLGLLDRERPVTLMLVFDTSPSMEYKHSDMTRLELAKKRGLELLDQLPDDSRILMIDSAEPDPTVRDDWHKSLDKARQQINRLTIRPSPAPVTKAIESALGRMDEWDRQGEDPVGQRYPRFLCVFSDRTQGCWDHNHAMKIHARMQRLQKDADVKLNMLFFDVGIDEPADLAITQLALPERQGQMRQSFAAGEKIPLRVTLKATGKGVESSMICQVGKQQMPQAFNLQADEMQTLTFEIDSAAWQLGPGLHQAEVKLETADALPFNNRRHATFEIRDKTKILVLVDNVKKTNTFAAALKALLYDVDVQPAQEKTDLDRGDYAAVFLDGLAAPTDSLWQMLTTYVQQGGGVGIIPAGDELKPGAYNSEAAQKIMPGIIGAKVQSNAGLGSSWLIPEDAGHPFLVPYQAWLDQGTTDISRYQHAYFYWDIEAIKKKDARVIVRYDDEKTRPAVLERLAENSTGKVLLLTTPMEGQKPQDWNNYRESLSWFYVAVTQLCARHLCKEPANPTLNYRFGAGPPMVQRLPSQAFAKYLLDGPDITEEVRFDDKLRWQGDRLPRAGNYSLTGTTADKEDPKTIAKFSINVPSEESELSRVPVEEVQAALGENSVIRQDRKTALRDTMDWNEPVELFPWLMILLLLFLAIENLLANRFYRANEPREAG